MKMIKKSVSLLAAALLTLQMIPMSACNKGSSGDSTPIVAMYDVAIESSAGGSVTADVTEVAQGKDVTFTITAQDGYVLDSLTVNGGKVNVTGNTYVFAGVICDLDVQAKFARANVTVRFKADGEEVQRMEVKRGNAYGELPTIAKPGKKFLYWANEKGQQIRPTSIIENADEITLTAVWGEITAKEAAGLVPFSATTAYYDMAATKYGVVFHTRVKPITPQIVVSTSEDFANPVVFNCDYEGWFEEYVVKGVVENLAFDTEYFVKFGDYSADVWSDVYSFTTREEVITEVNFAFATDSQETYLLNDKTNPIGTTYFAGMMTDAFARFPDIEFIVHGGDVVNHGAETECWEEMFGSIEEYLFKYPMMVAPGNHEGDGWYSAGYECIGKMFNIDVLSSTEAGFFYSFDYGPMHFVAMRTNDVHHGDKGMYTQEQLDWLKADLADANENPNVKWIVAMGHQGIMIPTHSVSTTNDYSVITYPQLMPIFDEYKVDLFLYGHNHYLDSTYPVNWSGEIERTAYDSYLGREVDYYRIDLATKTTEKVMHDGVEVDKFVYADGATKRGTVMHQTGCAGDQYDSRFTLADLERNLAEKKYYRMLLSTGSTAIDGSGGNSTGYSMYSYLEVTGDKLVCRTYGVNVPAQVKSPSLDNAKYLDGFMLQK